MNKDIVFLLNTNVITLSVEHADNHHRHHPANGTAASQRALL